MFPSVLTPVLETHLPIDASVVWLFEYSMVIALNEQSMQLLLRSHERIGQKTAQSNTLMYLYRHDLMLHPGRVRSSS